MTTLESYGLHLRHRILELENLKRQAEAKVHEQRLRVLEAGRQFELLDRLHQKARLEWVAASNKSRRNSPPNFPRTGGEKGSAIDLTLV
ncbi:MAG TPA: hypothetical protein VEV37_04030 [Bryobacteraceae bacterium]|nr:hypothetical protein [Bryobacteraceae bacterium]